MIKTKFIINHFHKLSMEEQKQIMDFVNGMTPYWRIKEYESK